MLNDEVIEALSERLTRRAENLNTYIIKQIGESIKEVGKLTPTQAMQLEATLKYGGSFEKITKEIARVTKLNVKDIYEIYEKLAKQDQRFASTFYKYRGVDFIPYEKNATLKRQVESLAKITADSFVNFSNTRLLGYGFQNEKGKVTFKGLKQTYYDVIDEAILSISEGKETFNQKMSKIIKDMSESGLKVIYPTIYTTTDKNGRTITKHYTRRFDSAVRMNIQDGLRQLHNTTQEIFGKEFESDGVEISVHTNPAPDHALVQGRQFSNEEFEKFQNDEDAVSYDGIKFPAEFDGNDRRSISEYNCYHYIFSIILGASRPAYSDEELQELIDRNEKGFEYENLHYSMYEGQQLLRKIELELRKSKDAQIMARASGISDDIVNAQKRINVLTDKYREVLKASGLRSKLSRASVSGYRKVKV